MKRLLIASLASIWIGQSLAESTTLLTLHDAVFLALRHNFNIKSKELDRTVRKFDLALAYHNFEPQWSLSGTTNYSEAKTKGFSSSSESYSLTPKTKLKTHLGSEVALTMTNSSNGSQHSSGLTLDVTQPLLRGFGPAIANIELLDAVDREKINRLELKRMVMEEIRSVITQYHQLLLDYNALRVNKLSLQNTINTSKRTEIEAKAGRTSGIELLQSKSNIPKQQLEVSQTENQIVLDKNKLLNFIGLQSDFQFSIPQTITVQRIKPPSRQECINIALANNNDYQIALINLKITERTLQKALDEARWKLDLKANASTGASGPSVSSTYPFDSANNSKSIGLELEVPLDTLQAKKNIAQAKIDLQKQRMELAQKRRELELEVDNKLNKLASQAKQIEFAITSRDIERRVLAAEQKKLEFGRSSVFLVNTFQERLLQSEKSVIQEQIQYLEAVIDLQSFLGTLLDAWQIEITY